MEYIRQFLIMLRKQDNREDTKRPFRLVLGVIALSFILIGVLIDIILPFNFLFNALRGVVANIVGFVLFSVGYLTVVRIGHKKQSDDRYYKPLRKRFSYRQRVNLSVLLVSLVVLLVLINGHPSNIYTLKAGLAIVALISLTTFSRKSRDEFLKSTYEIPDIRDVEFQKRKTIKDEDDKD